ncbi:MAG: HYR domain-containing protein, partial [Planctomycetota bacterium]
EVSLDSNRNPDEFFDVGSTDVTYTATDIHGNSSSGTFSVTVSDDEHPALVGLSGDISMTAEEGACSAVVNWIEVESTDNCGIESLVSDHHSGEIFPVGDTIVTYTTVDIHNNVTVGDFVITITDDENPEFVDLPERVTVNSETGLCSAAVLWSDPLAVDNCGIESISLDHDSGEQFPVGDTTVTVVAEDIHENLQTTQFIVTVVDQEVPQILNVPVDVISGSDVGVCGASITWSAPTAEDNCGIATFVLSHESGSIFDIGTTVVTMTAVDIHNNISSAAFLVTVEDTEDPAISGLPAALDYDSDLLDCSAVVDWDQPTVTDNCGIASVSSSHQPGATFPVGTTEVSYTAIDIHDNALTTNFFVTVTDVEYPQIIDLPDRITIPTEPGLCEGVAGWSDPETVDNCGVESLETNIVSGTALPVGETEVSYTVTDIHGNAWTESFIVTVEDQEYPQIIGLSGDIDQNTDTGSCGALVTWAEPTTTDNCGIQSTETTHTSGDFFEVGTTEVTLTTTDIHGNSASQSFLVTINDQENPEISGLPQDLQYSSEPGVCSATASWADPTASDNCGIDEFTSSHLPGDTFPVGLSEVTYTALDVHGNHHSSSFTIVVVDDEFPEILEVPGVISVGSDDGICGSSVEWQSAVATDNCSVLFFDESHSSGDIFPVGTTTVGITATDSAGNTTTAFFTITVNDFEDPALTNVPEDQQESSSPGQCGAQVEWPDWSSSDNCAIASMESNYSSGDFFEVGSTEVVLTATDIYGNSNKATFTVFVTDIELPQINGTPNNLEVETDPGQCGANVSWTEPSGSDNCGLSTLESSHGNGGLFAVGATEVVYVATDIHGNKQTSSFSVLVVDTEYPVILNVPSNITVSNDSGMCGAVVTWQQAMALDNCSVVGYEETHLPGTYFPVGTTPVTLAATDEAGNRTLAQFDVTVEDNETPELLNVPVDIAVDTDHGQCTGTATWSAPGAHDNCDLVDLQVSHSSGTSFPLGDTTVIVLAEDQYGNQSAGSFVVSVSDNEDPMILDMPENISVANDTGACGANIEWNAPGSQDNCEGETIEVSSESGDFFPVGTTEITVMVTDSSGNSVTSSFTATVHDVEEPTVQTSGDISVEAAADTCNANVVVPEPVGADNCSVDSITNDYTGTGNASGVYELGTSVVTWTIIDIHGNENTATQSITVTVDETDCNGNEQPDVCEIASGSAEDCNGNGIPDECEDDCNGNGTPDDCDISSGGSSDTNENGTPDECEQQFQRGDANTTGTVDVTDPIYILQYVIGTGPAPECMDSGDCNNDESLDISDAVYLLTHLFLATPPPAAPYGSCGIDPDGVSIGCDSYPICP